MNGSGLINKVLLGTALLTITCEVTSYAQESLAKKYGVNTISTLAKYRDAVAKDSSIQLMALDKFIPGIKLDIRYATSNNFMKKPVYKKAAAYLSLPAARALAAVQQELKTKGYGLKIWDGYRPWRVTVSFYEKTHDSVFTASPYTGSRHNRACAVDLTIIDLKTGKELAMPTPYDDFTKKAHTNYPDLPANALKNRELLKGLMTKHGFDIYPDEWWHYDFAGWKTHPLMDIPFEEL